MKAVSWVVGAGGLLGSGISRNLNAAGETVVSGPRVRWGTPEAIDDLTAGLSKLVTTAAGGVWQVYWCAGVGVTGSNAEAFRAEVTTFEAFLDSARALPANSLSRGNLFVASSAGGVYGGSQGAPFHELSETAPLGPYGWAKLAIEGAAASFAQSTGARCLIGRISNLYGPGQSLAKPQGLISHLCLSSLARKPLSVFVSLDTLRDYLYVDDGAELIVAGCRRLRQTAGAPFHIKIFAAGRSVSIGALLSEFRRVSGRRPEIVLASSPQSALQSIDLRLLSRYWPELDRRATTNLTDGIARTLQDIRSSFLRPTEPSHSIR